MLIFTLIGFRGASKSTAFFRDKQLTVGYDVDRLNDTLDELLTDLTRPREHVAPRPQAAPAPAAEPPTPTPDPPAPVPAMPTPPPPPDTRLILEGMIVGGLAACAGRRLAFAIPKLDTGVRGHAAGDVILRQTETWALVGAVLAIWLAGRTRRTGLPRLGMMGCSWAPSPVQWAPRSGHCRSISPSHPSGPATRP